MEKAFISRAILTKAKESTNYELLCS